jgi:hypothetical protein
VCAQQQKSTNGANHHHRHKKTSNWAYERTRFLSVLTRVSLPRWFSILQAQLLESPARTVNTGAARPVVGTAVCTHIPGNHLSTGIPQINSLASQTGCCQLMASSLTTFSNLVKQQGNRTLTLQLNKEVWRR